MTVEKLIAELKKYPKHLKVGYQAHDNKENELQDYIKNVLFVNFDNLPKDETSPKGKMIILRS